jgi:hypothetical protein
MERLDEVACNARNASPSLMFTLFLPVSLVVSVLPMLDNPILLILLLDGLKRSMKVAAMRVNVQKWVRKVALGCR